MRLNGMGVYIANVRAKTKTAAPVWESSGLYMFDGLVNRSVLRNEEEILILQSCHANVAGIGIVRCHIAEFAHKIALTTFYPMPVHDRMLDSIRVHFSF